MNLEELEAKWKSQENWLDKVFPHGIANYRAWHALTHPWIIVADWGREIRWAWQRVFRPYGDERISWSVDYYLSGAIPVWMKQLKDNKQGIPMMVFGDNDYYPDGFTSLPGSMEKAEAKYNAILNTIIEGFELYHEDSFEVTIDKEKSKKFDDAMTLFAKYFGTFWD